MKINSTYIFIIVVFFSLNTTIFGQISERTARVLSEQFLQSANSKYFIDNYKKLKIEDYSDVFVFQLEPVGFIIVSSKEIDNPILGFSLENNFSFDKNNIEIVSSFLDQNQDRNQKVFDRIPDSEPVGPLLKSLFGQVNCYDNDDKLINVSNLYTPNNYAPGCVAISLATLLHYYQWPLIGVGEHTYNDNLGSSRGVYTANFDETEYDWDNVLDRYNYKNSTEAQRSALGELVFHAAIALDMNFEYNGATSNISRIPNVGEKYFRFNTKRVPATSFVFWKVVDSNLVHKMPVIFSISASNGAGHSIVCDGFKFKNGDEYHHVNMGWWGTSNGWYRIKNGFSVGGYNKIDHGLINFIPIPMMNKPIVSSDSSELEINWVVSNVLIPEAFELQFKTDTSNWTKIADTITTNDFVFTVDPSVKEYSFRVKSEIDGKWYPDNWSNVVIYKKKSTSTVEGFEKPLMLYPNPCKDILNIELECESRVTFISLNGKVFYEDIHTGNTIISTENIEKGIYIVRVQNGTKSYVTKLVKID